ncbi:enoyl-CoA hydratase/isomerase [Paenibacillus sp. NAIST15-1]|uniref:enoyl-CoA hydratase/isomerase n=1 Tax=Paenibacillus sp. NAIST15-1 TaxID=1605994 RepID=UPI00086B8E52|nr:enoyl-CoA hydratase/isomerase [Paenibacillus sp. NAIST15-1]GAV11585.1 enoyl-CoA hydratase/isomerase [Paenibacillus sp. NAIST15-1]
MNYQTIKVNFQNKICYIQIYRPDEKNTINELLIEECHAVLDQCEESINIVVLEGLPEVFCFGADFQDMYAKLSSGQLVEPKPERLYDLWLRFATGPYITISHVRGKVNAGGVGFVAASDIVLSDMTAQFSLSELLFGVFPAAVLPFLIRRVGIRKANYLTLMTQPYSVQQALECGMVDACDNDSQALLRKHLLRLRPLSKKAILRYKRYMGRLDETLELSKQLAVEANKEVFSDPQNLEGIRRYVEKGIFPWEN